ncbi:MAG: hypothetical protein AAGA89_13895 [Pseudomonadota bacterium]
MFSKGDKGKPIWKGSEKDLAHCQAWLSAVEKALMTDETKPAKPDRQLMQELELAKQTLEQAIVN